MVPNLKSKRAYFASQALRQRHSPVRAITLGVAVVLFFVLCALPVLYMIAVSATGDSGGLSLDNYKKVLTGPNQRELLANSFTLGAGAAILATVLGAPLGLMLARVDVPARRFVRFALIIPLVIPPYILALAWIYIAGPVGLIARAIGYDVLSGWTYSLPGAVGVLGIGFYPIPMLATEAAARRVDGRLEEAALLVTGTVGVLRRVTLPLIAPAVTASTLITFVLALSEFGVPGLLRVRVYTTEVFTAFSALYDFGAATALSTPLLLISGIAGLGARVMIGSHLISTRRSSHPGLPIHFGRWRYGLYATAAAVSLISVILPAATLGFEAGSIGRVAAATGNSINAIFNSLVLSSIGATLIVSLAAILGYGRSRILARWGPFADVVLIAVFAAPSTVVGVGIIGLWNRPGLLNEIYSGPGIILVAYFARFLPVAVLMLAANTQQVSISSEEAAEVAGSGWARTFTRIVVPQLRSGLMATWVIAFIFTFGELGATTLVTPPGESTLPVRIYTLIANTPSSEVAALALAQVCMVLLPLALVGYFVRGESDGR